ncbi:MAG: sugar phosphate isomerase/epimerase [Planctomycetota bacterium]|jgi:sugar phosphate isomerase/epimerase|nr:sugar phosphate isomerase/epimerase [Planctomycetota bacterium]
MFFTGFADEAASSLSDQLRIIAALGWRHIDLRNVDGTAVHDLAPDAVDALYGALDTAGVSVPCIGSHIANGRARITDDPSVALEQTARCISLCQRLACTRVRVMSWPPGDDHLLDGPTAAERFKRLRDIHRRFADAGIEALHENCHNYGGQSPAHTVRLIEEVSGLRLIFDTANPVGAADHRFTGELQPRQSVFEFYRLVRDHVAYIHIKDATFDPSKVDGKFAHCWPGEGMGDVRAVIRDAIATGYDDAICIEPHVGGVHLLPGSEAMADDERREANFLEYGKRIARIMADLGCPIAGAAV